MRPHPGPLATVGIQLAVLAFKPGAPGTAALGRAGMEVCIKQAHIFARALMGDLEDLDILGIDRDLGGRLEL